MQYILGVNVKRAIIVDVEKALDKDEINIKNQNFEIGKNVMGKQWELNQHMVDSKSTALIHLATFAPSLI
ncbi:hypothetical protein IEQ34_010777 [Dendrobium chrysotoxum]|uniref:Uncharacterized protein n=1 Tax=Dendrobium chrysotoxum TaxID=161865 RepID=A0AAV7GXD4_DENCH|nr:hypothetical protein IEQ34_010777 [Dendrobium chrysotoxum]